MAPQVVDAGREDADGRGRRWWKHLTSRPGPLRNLLTTAVVGVAIMGIVWYFERAGDTLGSRSVSVTAAASGPAPELGKPAPDFRVQGLDGNEYQLSDFRGQPVWLSFWATWCPPCRAENPDIQSVYQAYRESGLVILAVSIGEERDAVASYAERTGLTYLMGLDRSTAIAAQYRIVGIPTHYFIDRDGVLREFRIGGLSRKVMEKKVAELMAAESGAAGGR